MIKSAALISQLLMSTIRPCLTFAPALTLTAPITAHRVERPFGGVVVPADFHWRRPSTHISLADQTAFINAVVEAGSPETWQSAPSEVISHISQLFSSEQDIFKYAFMFPTAMVVSTCCQLAGIGGAALLSPIFLLVFPFLGPDYPLSNPSSAIASALLTEVFGFASGLAGYAKRELVDWRVAAQFMAVSIPAAFLGAAMAKYLASDIVQLRIVYAVFMLALAAFLALSPRPEAIEEACEVPLSDVGANIRNKTSSVGQSFTYLAPEQGSLKSAAFTATGGALTGLPGVGVGEVVLPQLVRTCCMPLPVAAGTSVAAVVGTALTAALVNFYALAHATGGDIIDVVPWNLVMYTIPGVLIGGQLAPFLANKGSFSDEHIERFAATIFATVGSSFALKVIVG